jgi:hypothetical protein
MLINEQMYLDLQLEQIFQYVDQLYFQQLLITIIMKNNVRRIYYEQIIRACVSSCCGFDNGIAIPNKCIIPIVDLSVVGVCDGPI